MRHGLRGVRLAGYLLTQNTLSLVANKFDRSGSASDKFEQNSDVSNLILTKVVMLPIE